LQNLPKKIEGLRRAFVAEKGYIFVTGDYSNLEVRVLAEEADDDVLRKELTLNVHDENTKTLFGLKKSDPMWKYARRGAKIFMFGGIQYGGGDIEVHSNILSEVPKLGLTLDKYREAKEAWMRKHPGYKKWSRAKNNSSRVASTFMGRKRQLMGNANDIYKEKLNTPIQGGAAHIINRAMIRIEDIIEEQYYDEIKTVLQIHDELVYEVPTKYVDSFKKILKHEMERPVNFYNREVSFPADISIGPNLQDLKEE
jgi:DNA polymerase-1